MLRLGSFMLISDINTVVSWRSWTRHKTTVVPFKFIGICVECQVQNGKKGKDRDFLGGHGRSLWLLQKLKSLYINLANIKVTLKDFGRTNSSVFLMCAFQ